MRKFIYRYEVMSTPCELIIFTQTKDKADSVADVILKESKRLEKKYNYYSEDSVVSKLNTRENLVLDSESKTILQRAQKYYKLTDGIFDITIATIKDIYRFSDNLDEFESKKEVLKPYIGCEHFKIKKDRLLFDNIYTKIDLGGFVKEYAVDRVVSILKKNKISSALVNYGGDIYALGRKPNGEKFVIGIKDPKDKTKFATYIEIENEALTTSASYERGYDIAGRRYSHIISTKENIDTPNSVTVISPSCVESGIYSTSLMVDKTIKTANRVVFL